VRLDFQSGPEEWTQLGHGVTDTDGRVRTLLATETQLMNGVYRLTFDIAAYQQGFYPHVIVTFRVDNPQEHYHVPLLLGAFGYTTYRGS